MMLRALRLTLALLLAAAPAWAFPTVAATNTSSDSNSSDGITVSLPSGIASGHLLVCGIATQSPISSVGWSAGWTELYDQDGPGSDVSGSVAYRVADGGEGSTISVSRTGGTDGPSVALCYRITGQHASSAPEAGTPATGTSANPNPPTLSPSWGAEDTLWLVFGHANDNPTWNSAPTNYTNLFSSGAASNAGIGSARRELNATSDDPGTFGISAIRNWVTGTVVVRPAEAGCTGPRRALMGVGC